MKRILFLILCLCGSISFAYSQSNEVSVLKRRVDVLSANQSKLKKDLQQATYDAGRSKKVIKLLKQENAGLQAKVDSLSNVTAVLANTQSANNDTINNKISNTDKNVASSQSTIANRTTWGIAIIVLVVILVIIAVYYILRKVKTGSDSIESTIDEVCKAQVSLQNSQKKLQEDSIKLDNKLLDIAQQQLDDKKKDSSTSGTVVDHSLALKVADEVARIEMNMSRMDPSVKGFKQLKKAVERIKDNYKANGYEIADMLGKPYNEGMRVNADFVVDEDLKPGERIITGITKPQVVYNGELIQKATIKVSQNI